MTAKCACGNPVNPRSKFIGEPRCLACYRARGNGGAVVQNGQNVQTGPPPTKVDIHNTKEREKHIRKLEGKRTLWDAVGMAILEAVEQLEPPGEPPIIEIESFERSPEEWNIVFSDPQVGQIVDPMKTGGLGRYSTAIFLERLERFEHAVSSIFAVYHGTIPTPRLNIFFLGDIIEGTTIFRGQSRQTDSGAAQQVIVAADAISGLVSRLSLQFEEVACYCVIGNHGRIGMKGDGDPVHDNLDFLVYKFMEERLKSHSNISFVIPDTWWLCVERLAHRFFLVHGDDVRGWMNIPFYGAERVERRTQRMVRFDYFIIGHHHTPAEFSNVIMNGTWVGGSEFSLKNMALGGMPSQKIFKVHPTKGITCSYNVQLADASEFEAEVVS